MLIIPAIDIRGGKCVRLRQGDYAQETVFNDDPVAVAKEWVEQGATYLHLVDLDGAKHGVPVNLFVVKKIVKAAGVPCELGGGLRHATDLEMAFMVGIDRVVIGTQAFKKPEWFVEMLKKHPNKIMLGIDAKNGKVATEGWLHVSEFPALDLAQRFEDFPLAGIIYTDISKDGMMEGPNLGAIAELAKAVNPPVYASGGVTTLGDIRLLNRLPVAGCIIGRALYEGTLDLKEALAIANRA